ncbi:MAG: molybdopterin molybdenumtransferase MoeA, partial [Phycisphaerae bacterium]
MAEDRPMIPLARAWAIVDEALAGRPSTSETVPVRSARRRVLAEDQQSRLDLPPFDKSAMDGYAV